MLSASRLIILYIVSGIFAGQASVFSVNAKVPATHLLSLSSSPNPDPPQDIAAQHSKQRSIYRIIKRSPIPPAPSTPPNSTPWAQAARQLDSQQTKLMKDLRKDLNFVATQKTIMPPRSQPSRRIPGLPGSGLRIPITGDLSIKMRREIAHTLAARVRTEVMLGAVDAHQQYGMPLEEVLRRYREINAAIDRAWPRALVLDEKKESDWANPHISRAMNIKEVRAPFVNNVDKFRTFLKMKTMQEIEAVSAELRSGTIGGTGVTREQRRDELELKMENSKMALVSNLLRTGIRGWLVGVGL